MSENKIIRTEEDGVIYEKEYDKNDRLIKERKIEESLYKYDERGNKIWEKRFNGEIYEWKYDENNNKIWVKYPDGYISDYEYYENGKPKIHRYYNKFNNKAVKYKYDEKGEILSMTILTEEEKNTEKVLTK